jgi:DNA helicase II / ATP-dependent DNA helicase PcrA
MGWSDELSGEQRELASHDGRVVRLVAGPGTGKTRVMTRRVAYLVEDKGVNPSAVLALTFSRAAAGELRERLELLLGKEAGDRPTVSTLHGFALRQLLLNGSAPTLPQPIRIADDFDERHVIMEEIARQMGKGFGVREVQKELNALAADWETLKVEEDEWEKNFANPKFLEAWRRHRRVYGYTLRAELVYALKKALDEDPELQLEPAFTQVLVDEYQDLNRCEIAVLQRLTGHDRSLFAAGDDDQSIYGFRKAFPQGLREFGVTYPGSTDEELTECHRCDRNILALALAVAEQDVKRIEKELECRPDADDGHVQAISFANISAEARGIAEIAARLVESEKLSPRNILILLRNDPGRIYSTPLVEALAEHGLDAELPSDPLAILDDDDGRRLVCILRLIREPDHDLAWRELLKLRPNRIGDATLFAVFELAAEKLIRYHEALEGIADDPSTFESGRSKAVAEEVAEIKGLLADMGGLLDEPAEDGLDRALDAVAFSDGEDREQLKELLMELVEDVEEATLGDVEEALHTARSGWDKEEESADEDQVRIMTMHAAKGLTADAVIIAACENELVPGWPEDERARDDERRLLYVSLTRARHFLYMTFARRRTGQQSHRLQSPSPGLTKRTFTEFLTDYITPTAG